MLEPIHNSSRNSLSPPAKSSSSNGPAIINFNFEIGVPQRSRSHIQNYPISYSKLDVKTPLGAPRKNNQNKQPIANFQFQKREDNVRASCNSSAMDDMMGSGLDGLMSQLKVRNLDKYMKNKNRSPKPSKAQIEEM